MKTPRYAKLSLLFVCILMAADAGRAANIPKANDTDNLNLTTSWVGGAVPGAGDVATWNSTVAGANATSLGASTNWLGIQILNPGGPVQINADGNTLTNGTGGIDMSAATQSLTLNNNVVLGAGPQNWSVASGQTLTLGGNLARNTGSGLRFYLPDLSAGGAHVSLTNGTPNWLLGGTTNSTFTNVFFATINDMDIAAFNGSMQIIGGQALGVNNTTGPYLLNTSTTPGESGTWTGQNPTVNANAVVADFSAIGAQSVGWRLSGSVTWGVAYLNESQTYTGVGAIYYNGAPAWLVTHTSGRNLTVYTVLMTTNLGTSAFFDNVGATTIIGTAGTRDMLVYQNNPVAPYVMQT
ncbi:MAG TPA: hypothetical protein VGH42_06600, partial [Verrucomicrobiae bacterium]